MITTVVFLFMTLAATTISSIDYCAESLCDGEKHIACSNDGKFHPDCPSNVVKIEFTDKLKKLAVDSQNAFRDQIARGKLKRYDQAARMATLVWDDELAKLAELNVRRCRFGHDECRNTAIFMYAGQNLGMLENNKALPSAEKVIESITKGWFDEHKDAGMDYIDKFSHHKSGLQIGHFTQLVRDQAYAVGCAIVQYKRGIWYTSLYACDYSLSNIQDNPVYEKAKKTASGCKKGTNKEYPGLCHASEIFDNDLFYNKA